ncbi:DUF2807 domain-containing protein [Parabacteroides distasonis]|uniref:DUF2807 domain-containing protein n=1 Tax=Parabacteroides distasonis TaxID=823 RepID=UPI001F17A926|nr:DUF2807 domain-containing protein [Parabacteroides distasonis]MCE9127514.1 DUF2807 domain-containing protein [Parabacteroides distasonis]
MKTFEELKKDLLERAKKHNACQDGYRMGLNAKSKQDLLKAITNNWYWVLSASKMIDANYLENNFSEEELAEAGIYTRKEHTSNAKSFACGSATVEAYGSATVEAYGSATVKAYDSATVEAYGSATVEAYDSATVEAYDSATVEAYDSATVEAYDSAKVEAYDNSYVEDCTGNINTVSDHGIVKDYHNHKIYIKKGKFKIIEIE